MLTRVEARSIDRKYVENVPRLDKSRVKVPINERGECGMVDMICNKLSYSQFGCAAIEF